ncbi:hypothetical protein GCM10009759_45500 [Kitasatospora saccharophila]|uniref:Uncharacterized protein n=1 Tax=Kitasatospora saccharophila TaxID=407973 RepID=A0ABN2X9K7_9ACTN
MGGRADERHPHAHRRLARDYDHRLDKAASRVYWASTADMLRRLTIPSPAWRDDVEPAA